MSRPRPDERRELLAVFAGEAGKRIGRLERGLAAGPAAFRDLAREAHALRGSAAVLGLAEIEEGAAALEAGFALGGSGLAAVDAAEAERAVERLRALVAALDPGSAPAQVAEAPTDAGAPVVLHVEDSPANLRLAARILAGEGLSVVAAARGEDAVRVAAERPPALVLLDLRLEDMDGEDVLRRLRERPETRDVPVVVLTGGAEQERLRGLSGLGVHAVVLKPFDPAHLLRVVRNALAGG